jgi:hypothetical protein
MKNDDINMFKIYNTLNIPKENLIHIQEGVLDSARKWFDKLSGVQDASTAPSTVAYNALEKAKKEIERYGYDSSKILTPELIAQFIDLIEKEDAPSDSEETSTEITRPEENQDVPTNKPEQDYSDSNVETLPPKTATNTEYKPKWSTAMPIPNDLEAFYKKEDKKKEEEAFNKKIEYYKKLADSPTPLPDFKRAQAKAILNKIAKEKGEPLPYPQSQSSAPTQTTTSKTRKKTIPTKKKTK